MKGFERRARRARRTRHVDRPVARSVVDVGRADAGADLAGLIVDDDDRRRQFRPEPRDALLRQRLELRLQPRVDREADRLRLRVGGDRLLGGVRGELGKRLSRLRDGLAPRRRGVVGADDPPLRDAREHPVAGGARRRRETVRAARLGRLRQRDEQRRLGDAELERLLAEPGERGGAHALEIAAEGRHRQIAVEDAGLADRPLDLARARDLPQLRRDRPLGARLDQARDLHRQRRAARDDMAAPEPLPAPRAGARAHRRRDAR